VVEWVNDDPRSPLRFQVSNEEVIGQFYNSWDKMFHLAKYRPCKSPPREYLCGGLGNFSLSRKTRDRERCPVCWGLVETYEK
jgi:hypothetical protein